MEASTIFIIIGAVIGGLLLAGIILASIFGLAEITDNITSICNNINEVASKLEAWFVSVGESIVEFFTTDIQLWFASVGESIVGFFTTDIPLWFVSVGESIVEFFSNIFPFLG